MSDEEEPAWFKVTIEGSAIGYKFCVTHAHEDLAWALAYALQAIQLPRVTSEELANLVCAIHEGEDMGDEVFPGHNAALEAMTDAACELSDGWKKNDADIERMCEK